MQNNSKAQVMDAQAIENAIVRIAHEINERNQGAQEVAIVGIQHAENILPSVYWLR